MLTYCAQRSLWIAFGRKVIVNGEGAVVRASPNSPVGAVLGPPRAGHRPHGRPLLRSGLHP